MNNLQSDHANRVPDPDAHNWTSIRNWRIATRASLIRARIGIGKDKRKQCLHDIQRSITEILSDVTTGIIGFYWPIKGEFDIRNVVADFLDLDWQAALPVVVEKGAPLEFRLWRPDMKLVPGVWNIPMPQERNIVTPSVLIIPLVGVDQENYRLGYGGGYYDRTLASLGNTPLTIGIGLESCRLKTIYPQWHDIAMDKIVITGA